MTLSRLSLAILSVLAGAPAFADDSGVDLDQEIAELIRVQTAYTAAARMITATEELFDTLFAAIR